MRDRSFYVVVSLCAALAGCAAPLGEETAATSEARLAEGDAVVNVDGLNLRAGPSTGDEVLAVMRGGERVRVLGEPSGGFSPVRYGELTGWAFAEYLTPVRPVAIGSLAGEVASLAAEAGRRSPGTELGIAVMNLTTGEYAGAGDDVRHVSASSAKVMWVAAAMHAGADVSDIARPIFERSDNDLAGTAIDRAGGIDAVNAFYWDVAGMEHSIVANWSFGVRRVARDQGLLGGDNYFTPRDVVTFLSRLDSGAIAGAERLGEYMTWSPRAGYGGWLGSLLPDGARATMMHKAGWLPPPAYAAYSTLNEVGIVQVPGGDRYAIALLARHGADWGAEARMVERASCVVYRAVARETTLPCND